jgi:hypothetical protein
MAMRKRSLKTSFEITGPDALFHMMSIRFRSDTTYIAWSRCGLKLILF